MSKKYYKFYTATGNSCRIKISGTISGQVLIRMKAEQDERWLYHSPSCSFSGELEVANYILKNLDSTNMYFKVSPMKTSIKCKDSK